MLNISLNEIEKMGGPLLVDEIIESSIEPTREGSANENADFLNLCGTVQLVSNLLHPDSEQNKTDKENIVNDGYTTGPDLENALIELSQLPELGNDFFESNSVPTFSLGDPKLGEFKFTFGNQSLNSDKPPLNLSRLTLSENATLSENDV